MANRQTGPEIIRTRHTTERDPKLPDADLVVVWQEEHATDVVDSPDLGLAPFHIIGQEAIAPMDFSWLRVQLSLVLAASRSCSRSSPQS